LVYLPEALRLTVRDNGQGFSQADLPHHLHRADAETPEVPGMPEARSGLGLLGMRERAALIGATLEIKSTPSAGTSIMLTVPAHSGG
jgi:signal transduction histidine kinase